MLEPSHRERVEGTPHRRAAPRAGVVDEDPVGRESERGGAVQEGVPGLVSSARPGPGGGSARSRRGAEGHVLPLPEGTRDASEDDERGGVARRVGAPANRSGEALQEGVQRYGRDREGAAGGGEAVRKLKAPYLMKDVYLSVRFVDGVRESKRKNRKDAA